MERPWMKLYSRDWLDNKELRRCSPLARSVLADLMCLAHEGEEYGFLVDKVGGLTTNYMANRCSVSRREFLAALEELVKAERVHREDSGRYFIKRMVEDERVRVARASGGSKGGNPSLGTHKVGGKVNLQSNLPVASEDNPFPRERTRADSDSPSSAFSEKGSAEGKALVVSISVAATKARFDEWIAPWQRNTYPDKALHAWCFCWTPDEDAAIFACRDRYLASKDAADGVFPSPEKFLYEQKQVKWKGKWPAARAPPTKNQGASTADFSMLFPPEGRI